LDAAPSNNILASFLKRLQNPVEQSVEHVSASLSAEHCGFRDRRSIALYGLVLALAGYYVVDQYTLSTLSLILLVYLYPSNALFGQISQQAEILKAERGSAPKD
jgi:hypothetical protein